MPRWGSGKVGRKVRTFLLLVVASSLWVSSAHAACLAPSQRAAFNTDVTVTHSAEFATAVTNRDYVTIANAYNLTAVPDFWVWLTSISRDVFLFGTSADGTTWQFTNTGYVTRTVQELQLFESLFNRVTGLANPSNPQVVAAFNAAMTGSGTEAVNNRTHAGAITRRKALRGEKLYAVGTGSTGSPATMAFEGNVCMCDVAVAVGGSLIPCP